MGRLVTNKLTVAEARSIKKPGRHGDGGGLYLKVRKSGSKSWVFIDRKNGKMKELGLGSFDFVGLADAREKAKDLRARTQAGLPLVAVIAEETKELTFIQCVDKFLKSKEAGWTNEKHRAQWHMTLKVYAKPLHDLPITNITTPHVLSILEPMWLTKNETASRLRGRIEAVMDYAKAMGWRTGENPALWRGNLKLLLPQYSRTQNIKHHAALPFEKMPQFMAELREREAVVAKLLEFIILTAARSGEARFATWDEIDFNNRTWSISAKRMKMSKDHVVPLCDSVYDLLKQLERYKTRDYIFEHPISRNPFSINATRALLQRMRKERLTTHGFRSTFRDWAGDQTMHQRETIEAALAHSLKDKAEAAYRRSTALEKRRVLMQDWDNYTSGQISN